MPKRRTEVAAPRPDAGDPEAFRPVRVIRVDVDSPVLETGAHLEPGDVVWAEAIRKGRIIGRLETHLTDGHDAAAVLDEVARAFPLADDDGEPPRVPDSALPAVSVVVSTLGERPVPLARTLASLEALDYPRFEVVLVDNRPGAAGPPLAFPGCAHVRVVQEPVQGIARGRNRGIVDSTSEVVAFTDDDVVVDPGWLRALASRFVVEPDLDAVAGLVLPTELATEAQLWFEQYYGGYSQSFRRSSMSLATERDPLFPYAPGRFGAGCNMAFRRTILERVHGFDPVLGTGTPARGGEDRGIVITVIRNGGALGFEPAALVRHTHRRTHDEFLGQVRMYGTGLAAMYTSLIAEDPRTLGELLRRVPAGFRLLVRPREKRSPSAMPTYPRRALLYQVLGMAVGPLAYARSRLAARRVPTVRP